MICISMFMALSADACSIARTMTKFEPNADELSKKHDLPIIFLKVPAPVVTLVEFERATSTVNGSCRSYAVATLDVSLPADSRFDTSDLGFIFRAEPERPQDPSVSFPNFPVISGKTVNNVSRFTFLLIDPPSARGQPFKLLIDVTAINHALQIGPSTSVLISQQ